MLETVIATAIKYKSLLAVLSVLLLGGSLFAISNSDSTQEVPGHLPAAKNQDPYVTDIQKRTELVNNSVYGVIGLQGKQEAWKYKQTCEDVLSYIQRENLEAEQAYLKLLPDQKIVNENYRTYLHEASFVVANYKAGNKPVLTTMTEAKAKLQ